MKCFSCNKEIEDESKMKRIGIDGYVVCDGNL
jgi:hypothetical protein